MNNLGIEQPSRSCTIQNSIHLPLRNEDVVSDRRELVCGSSSSVEFLFSTFADGVSTKFKKGNPNKCIPRNLLYEPLTKLLLQRHYSCTNYEKPYVTCNSCKYTININVNHRFKLFYAICGRNCPAT